jgi:hypothetical protein
MKVFLTLGALLVLIVWTGRELHAQYSFHRHPPPPMGKYEEIAVWGEAWFQIYDWSVPESAKLFVPIRPY